MGLGFRENNTSTRLSVCWYPTGWLVQGFVRPQSDLHRCRASHLRGMPSFGARIVSVSSWLYHKRRTLLEPNKRKDSTDPLHKSVTAHPEPLWVYLISLRRDPVAVEPVGPIGRLQRPTCPKRKSGLSALLGFDNPFRVWSLGPQSKSH